MSQQMHARSQLTVRSSMGGAVFAGIDSHKDTLAVALVDQVGLPVALTETIRIALGRVRSRGCGNRDTTR